MKDLSQISGLDIKMEDIGLTYDQNVFPDEPVARTFAESESVYLEKTNPNRELYWMYRYFEKADDNEKFENSNLEYDITVIDAGRIGDEYIKTIGHYHGNVPKANITYPEVYEVIDGQIEYLLQSKPDANDEFDVVIILADPGDKVVVPPNYGHISVNVGSERAVSSNIQKRDLPASSDYNSFAERKGGALYRKDSWINNPNYKVKSIKKVKPKEKSEWGLKKDLPLYQSVTETPEKFDFILNPQKYNFSDVWEDIQTTLMVADTY